MLHASGLFLPPLAREPAVPTLSSLMGCLGEGGLPTGPGLATGVPLGLGARLARSCPGAGGRSGQS